MSSNEANDEDEGDGHYQTRGQQIGVLCVLSFSSFLSLTGSISIIYLILRNKRWKRTPSNRDTTGGMFYRLLLGVSFSDAIMSIGTLISPYLEPPSSDLLAASGTQQSCSFAGTLVFVAISGLFYNGFLASYYYCTIVKGTKEDVLSTRYETWMHISSIGVMVVFNIVALCLHAYNPTELNRFCGLEFYPTGCNQEPDIECTRGLYTNELGIIALFIFAVPSINGVVLTVMVYSHVRNILNKSQKYRCSTNEQENRRKRRLAQQSVWYCLAYVNVVLWAATFSVVEALTNDTRSILGRPGAYTYLILESFFFPLQGFINFGNYVRPRYLDNRRRFPNQGRLYALLCVYCDEPPDYSASRAWSSRYPRRTQRFESNAHHDEKTKGGQTTAEGEQAPQLTIRGTAGCIEIDDGCLRSDSDGGSTGSTSTASKINKAEHHFEQAPEKNTTQQTQTHSGNKMELV